MAKRSSREVNCPTSSSELIPSSLEAPENSTMMKPPDATIKFDGKFGTQIAYSKRCGVIIWAKFGHFNSY